MGGVCDIRISPLAKDSITIAALCIGSSAIRSVLFLDKSDSCSYGLLSSLVVLCAVCWEQFLFLSLIVLSPQDSTCNDTPKFPGRKPKKSRTDPVHPSCLVVVILPEIIQRPQNSTLLTVWVTAVVSGTGISTSCLEGISTSNALNFVLSSLNMASLSDQFTIEAV